MGDSLVESDEELVLRTRRGDREAFSRLVQRYEPAAMAVAKSILGCWHEAGDAVQDAFVRAYEQLNRLWSPRKFGPWLMQIVRRQSLLHLRRQSSRSRQLARLAAGPAQGRTRDEEAAVDVMALIARLPAQECVVVSLRHLQDLPVADIARITKRPVGTVTKQLSRAYARMRIWLDGER